MHAHLHINFTLLIIEKTNYVLPYLDDLFPFFIAYYRNIFGILPFYMQDFIYRYGYNYVVICK